MSTARETLLKAPHEFKTIEAFGGKYSVLMLSSRERDTVAELSKQVSESKQYKGYREKVVILLLGDESGARVFTDADAEAVSGMSGVQLENVLKEGLAYNRLTAESADEAKKA